MKTVSIDTNVLLRAFLGDDEQQALSAQTLLEKYSESNSLYISSYAVLEFVWVLKTKNFSREQILEALLTLIDSLGVTIWQKEIVIKAMELYKKGSADFGDYMIMAESLINGTHKIASFDKRFLKSEKEVYLPEDLYELH